MWTCIVTPCPPSLPPMAAATPEAATDYLVPTCKSPPKREWTRHYWYVMFAAAMQASAGLSDEDVTLLVQSFSALRVTLCCPKCREHYKANFAACPYTAVEARDPEKSMAWVRNLRFRIEDSIKQAATQPPAVPPRTSLSCLPTFPGTLFPVTPSRQQLDDAIVTSLKAIKEQGDKEVCACTLGGRTYKPPTW